MYRIVSVDKDSISFMDLNDRTIYANMLNPIIYTYAPVQTVVSNNSLEWWHEEDFKRVKHIQDVIGIEFDSYDSMMKYCNGYDKKE